MGGGSKPTVPAWTGLNLADEQLKAISANADALTSAGDLATKTNRINRDQLTTMLRAAIPGYDDIVAHVSGNISDLTSGKIPSDVSQRVQQSTAEEAVAGGYGGTGASRNLTARDLGLTSLNLMQTGTSMAESWMTTMDRMFAPGMFDLTSMFVTPGSMFATDMANKEAQWGVQWLQNQIKAMPDPFGEALGQFLGGIGDTAASYWTRGAAAGGGQGTVNYGWSGTSGGGMGGSSPMTMNFGGSPGGAQSYGGMDSGPAMTGGGGGAGGKMIPI
jgi:hypothetical protein